MTYASWKPILLLNVNVFIYEMDVKLSLVSVIRLKYE